MHKATYDSKSQIEAIFHVLRTKEAPPTYFRTNKFTSSFQEIVDAYGWVQSNSVVFLFFQESGCMLIFRKAKDFDKSLGKQRTLRDVDTISNRFFG